MGLIYAKCSGQFVIESVKANPPEISHLAVLMCDIEFSPAGVHLACRCLFRIAGFVHAAFTS